MIRRILERWKLLMGVIVATSAVAGPVAAVGWDQYTDYRNLREQVASNTRSILATRYFELEKKRQASGLSPHEYNEFCDLGRQLGYFTNCPPARG